MKSIRKAMFRIAAAFLMLLSLVGATFCQSSGKSLEDGFKTPPNSAKPHSF